MTQVPRLPPFQPGMRIGLLGGSFNPPHEGHALVTRLALTRLGLDRVWWLVTPGNPLKSPAELAALQERVEAARRLVAGPRVAVTDIEAQIGARYTYDTLAWLARRAPGVRFVWLMGADNLRQFHHWRHWRAIADLTPIAVVDRPGSTLRAMPARPRWRSRGGGRPNATRPGSPARGRPRSSSCMDRGRSCRRHDFARPPPRPEQTLCHFRFRFESFRAAAARSRFPSTYVLCIAELAYLDRNQHGKSVPSTVTNA